MNDEETVALIAGGHTFGKTHGAAPATHVAHEPEAAGLEEQGLGWKNSFGTGKGGDTITSGLEVTWTTTPTKWSNNFFENLFGYEWELTKSPAGANQWKPKNDAGAGTVPHAHDQSKRIAPSMLTTDLALRVRPGLRENLPALPRESRPARRRLRPGLVQADPSRHGPARPLPRPGSARGRTDLARPDPGRQSRADRRQRHRRAEEQDPGFRPVRLANWSPPPGRRLRLSAAPTSAAAPTVPAFAWRRRRIGKSTSPPNWPRCSRPWKESRRDFNGAQSGGKKVSLADLIVLAGCAAVEQAAKKPATTSTVPFTPGRMDASQEQTDVESFAVLEPIADGFRNYLKGKYTVPAEALLIDKAQLLTLTAPEMTVLIGGLRVLDANVGRTQHGVFTKRPER